jgi:transposase
VGDLGLHRPPGPSPRRRREKKGDGSGGQADQALGRRRGGLTTKVPGAISGLGLPAKVLLTPGPAADVSQAEELREGLPPDVVIADTAYACKALVDAIAARGAEAVIPSLSNRKEQRAYDRQRSKDRNWVERFWHKLKPYRRVATRYEKTAQNFLAVVHVASIMILLRSPMSPRLFGLSPFKASGSN